jgi:hypothetical protein
MDPGFELPTGVYTHPFLQETSDITPFLQETSDITRVGAIAGSARPQADSDSL